MSARLVIVGDALLDRDVEGKIDRVAPDSGAPVLDEHETRIRPGGAGLAAAIAAAEGHEVTLIAALADDQAGAELASALALAGVRLVDLGLRGLTPQKVRLLQEGKPRLRLDTGGTDSPVLARNRDGMRRALEWADAILVSDYGRGVASHELVRAALAARLPGRPLVWDPHPRGSAPLPGATLATPNLDEASRLAPHPDRNRGRDPGELARALAAVWGVEAVCVTRGAAGAVLAMQGEPARKFPCAAAEGDPCGAGDRFAVAAAAALGAGAGRPEAVATAVMAAREFVAASGSRRLATSDRASDFLHPLGGRKSDALDLRGVGASPHSIAPALAVATRVRAQGGRVVATGGCFDLLHVGHVRTLEAARALGDCLVVLLNGDRSVRRLKGPERPLVGELERATMLKALGCVDEVAIFDEPVPDEALRLLKPDVWAKGGDYEAGELPEAEAVASWDGRIAILPYLEGRSTTRLIEEVGARVER
ncbi:MAG TPA: PfkB family carbohydrate kinase [Solirubrobacterales bacterium]|nr:PfkB family carbohydrate kinase [Solirubrobacterales bacterium]